jgi:hypothetical protein
VTTVTFPQQPHQTNAAKERQHNMEYPTFSEESARMLAQGTFTKVNQGATIFTTFAHPTNDGIVNLAAGANPPSLSELENDFTSKSRDGYLPVFIYYIFHPGDIFSIPKEYVLFEQMVNFRWRVVGISIVGRLTTEQQTELRPLSEAIYVSEIYPRLPRLIGVWPAQFPAA